jgi:hypothetical protein
MAAYKCGVLGTYTEKSLVTQTILGMILFFSPLAGWVPGLLRPRVRLPLRGATLPGKARSLSSCVTPGSENIAPVMIPNYGNRGDFKPEAKKNRNDPRYYRTAHAKVLVMRCMASYSRSRIAIFTPCSPVAKIWTRDLEIKQIAAALFFVTPRQIDAPAK